MCKPQELPGCARISRTGQRRWSEGPLHLGGQHVTGGMVGQDQGAGVQDEETGGLGTHVMGLEDCLNLSQGCAVQDTARHMSHHSGSDRRDR